MTVQDMAFVDVDLASVLKIYMYTYGQSVLLLHGQKQQQKSLKEDDFTRKHVKSLLMNTIVLYYM